MASARIYSDRNLNFKDSFRLIEVQAGGHNDPIRVSLVAARLDDPPPFEALSYVWGDPKVVVPIRVVSESEKEQDYSELPVTVNCRAAIQRLRRSDAPRTLWIDAICIDQQMISERNHQLILIPQIYACAMRVIVYLGEDADDSDTALGWIQEIDKPHDFGQGPQWNEEARLVQPNTGSIEKLLKRNWFRRIWVLQEILYASHAVVICGAREVDWLSFKAFRYWNTNTKWVPTLPYVVGGSLFQVYISRDYESFLSSFAMRLLKKLVDTRNIEATDPRDKVFAILPLLDWEEQRFTTEKTKHWATIEDVREEKIRSAADDAELSTTFLEAGETKYHQYEKRKQTRGGITIRKDYGLTVAQIYTSLAEDLINALGLKVICEVVGPASISGLPSWAPDWSTNLAFPYIGSSDRAVRHFSHPARFSDYQWHEDSESLHQTWSFSKYTPDVSGSGPDTQLHLHGHVVGTIKKVGDMANIYGNDFPLRQWRALIQDEHPDLLVPSEGNDRDSVESLSRFLRALTGDHVKYPTVVHMAVEKIAAYTSDHVKRDKEADVTDAPKQTSILDYEDSLGWSLAYASALEDEQAPDATRTTRQQATNQTPAQKQPMIPLRDIFSGLPDSYALQAKEIFSTCHGRCFFVTDSGRIGLAPETAQVGDLVTVFQGLDVPFVVRSLLLMPKSATETMSTNNSSGVKVVQLIRECFVQGFKAGSFSDQQTPPPEAFEEMIIR